MPRVTITASRDDPICPICEFWPHAEHSIYCEDCGRFLLDKKEANAKAAAMKNARVPGGKGFRCYYTGLLLDLKDPTSPRYPHFDHRTPGKKGDLVMCCAFVNQMKGVLTEDELWAVVFAYVDHLDGKPFPPGIAQFKYWRSALGPFKVVRIPIPRPLRTNAEFCDVCGEKPLPRAKYCRRCSWIIYHAGENLARVAALKRAFRKRRKVFVCRYTGLVLDTENPGSPLYINFDHVIPGANGRLEAVAAFINRMKTAMSKLEFDRAMRELARFKSEGGEFDEKVVRFKHWMKVMVLKQGM